MKVAHRVYDRTPDPETTVGENVVIKGKSAVTWGMTQA